MKKVCMISLGCSKNLVNSEKILALLKNQGAEFTNNPAEADEIIINTCSFIDSATEESIDMIREMGKYDAKLYVAGCLPERFGDEVFSVLPEVDGIIDTSEDTQANRVLSTPKGTAYLKIAEGCDNRCTFCVIPKIKGKYISFPYPEIIEEAKTLASQGVKELIIIAQDTTAYNDVIARGEAPWQSSDLYTLANLLKDLVKVEGIKWLRLHYCYPERITDELINLIAAEPKIVNYIDIPIQHCNNEILKKMGRRTRKEQLTPLLKKLKAKNIALRTSLMVGFPGETEAQFEELCEFIKEIKFERLGVFKFSPQEETPAALLKPQVDDEEKERRFDTLMQIQEKIAKEHAKSLVGKTLDVLIQGTDEEGNLIARTEYDSLDIDCLALLPGQTAPFGEIVQAKIIDTHGYDLIGEIHN